MKRDTYIGIIGIVAFTFATIQSLFIACYPMIGYLIFQASKGSYSASSYRGNTPIVAYIVAIVLFAISIRARFVIGKSESTKGS